MTMAEALATPRPSVAPTYQQYGADKLKLGHLSPGVTLSATDALASGQEVFTRDQVAYLIALAYESGRSQALADNLAETAAIWDEHPMGRCTVVRPRAKAVRDRRKTERLAEYERLAGPAQFDGGLPFPASLFPAERRNGPGPFPTLASQAEWLDRSYVEKSRSRHSQPSGRRSVA